jgi:hypothetical protein
LASDEVDITRQVVQEYLQRFITQAVSFLLLWGRGQVLTGGVTRHEIGSNGMTNTCQGGHQ